jgi:hypothetical protein
MAGHRRSLIARTFAGGRDLLATIFGGLWLILLYGITVWAVVGALAAIQIREDLQEDRQEDGATITFADVQRSHDRYLAAADALYAPLNETSQLYSHYVDLDVAIGTKVAEIQNLALPESQVPSGEFEYSAEFEQLTSQCIDAGFSSTIPVCGPISEYFDLRAEIAELDANLANVDFDKLYADVMKSVAELRDREPLARHFDTFEFFSLLLYEKFLTVPSQLLVLQLTMFMGMLGSVITMTWSFIKRDSGFTFRRFLILPFVGAMSAFIIFVFIKAGQLTLTAGNASEPLNPFVLSFVGIISGLLSERAYSRMAEVGGNFFKVDEDKSRYGIGLRAALEQSDLGEPELAGYLKLSEEETAAIVDGRAAASPLHQQLVAAGLRRSIREIFTDLPPDSAAPPPAAPPPAARPADPPVAEQPA